MPLAPSPGGSSGNIGRAFPALRLAQVGRAREPVVEHLVERVQRGRVVRRQRTSRLGAACDAHAAAEAADGDLVALVHQLRAGAEFGVVFEVAQRRGDRVQAAAAAVARGAQVG